MALAVSPLAPATRPVLPPLSGIRLAGLAAGLKKRPGLKDLMVAVLDPGTAVAGTLTRSRCPSAPVDWCRKGLRGGRARALVVNAGNANAFTGRAGQATVETTAAAMAAAIGCDASEVFLASTGVIGEPVAPDFVSRHLGLALGQVDADGWAGAAEAIMTTDTFPKSATAEAEIDGHRVTINGIAKGSGMIAPDMATMLAFVATDAAIAPAALQEMLAAGVEPSFNSITVDSDTSTSDTLLLFATARAGNAPVERADDPRARGFRAALDALLLDLALQVVRDGEGAQKLIEVRVTGAVDDASARRVALSIANSPLVKTAIAGEDANWGRVVMAVGKAGEPADRDRLTVTIGGVVIATRGERAEGYDEAPVAAHVKGREVTIGADLGLGDGRARVWTCDLTHGYISINADYRS